MSVITSATFEEGTITKIIGFLLSYYNEVYIVPYLCGATITKIIDPISPAIMRIIVSPTYRWDTITNIVGLTLFYYNEGYSLPYMWAGHYNEDYRSPISYYNEGYSVLHI